MKNIIKSILAIALMTGFVSCEDEQELLLTNPEGSFSITTPITGEAIVLNETTPTNPGISLTWSPMDYTTQSVVTYTVELAANGSNFASVQELGTTTSQFITIQSAQLNLAALTAGATPFAQSPVDIRIKATSGTTGTQPVYSSTLTYLITAYGCLGQYAVGAGIPSAGWNWNTPLSLICDNKILTVTATLANDTFRFFTTKGDWNTGRNYLYYANAGYKISSTLENANDGDKNFRFTGTPGAYRLKINENDKTVTVAQGTTAANSQWLVGAATPGGWSWSGSNETEFALVSNGIYEVPLKLNNGETFRVFLGNNGGDSWGLGDRNYLYYSGNGYTIDSELINANDGDKNFRYTGPTAIRLLTINSVTKSITVE